MAYQEIEIGTAANDGTGDTLRVGGDKVNDNFSEIYTLLGTGTALTSGISATSSIVSLSSPTLTGVVSFADGSAGAPSIANTGDANTGIFFSAADQVAISTGGTARLTVSSTAATFAGNLAIADAGTIGNATTAAAVTIEADGDIVLSDDLYISGGLIDLKNEGTVSTIKFYCESSNAHAQSLVSAPHAQGATNTLTLPDGSDGVLLSTVSTATVTNKTFTAPVINTATVGTSITPASDDGATLGSANLNWSDLFLADAAVIKLGDDQDVTLTHVHNTGILLNSTNVIQFNDASQNIGAPSNAILDINATDEIELNATEVEINVTTLDVNGNMTLSGTAAITGIATFTDDIIIGDGKTIGSATTVGAIAIAADGTVDLDVAGATVASAAIKVAGKESIWVPSAAMYPSTTNPCSDLTQVETTALRPDLKVLDFATGADDFAQFTVAFPKSWNEGTVTFQPFWTVTGTNTGTVAWALSGIAVTNDATINTAFGTAAVTTALAHSGTSNDLMVSVESGAITIAGSPSTDDVCFFQIARDVSADDQSGDARLIGIKLFFTTDAANDG